MTFSVSKRAGYKFADLASVRGDYREVREAYDAHGFSPSQSRQQEYGDEPIRFLCEAFEREVDRVAEAERLLAVYLDGIEDWGFEEAGFAAVDSDLNREARALVRELQRSGAPIDSQGRRSVLPFPDLDLAAFDEIGDRAALQRYIMLATNNVDVNPAAAIDHAKALVEAVLKAITSSRGGSVRRTTAKGKPGGPLPLGELASNAIAAVDGANELVPGHPEGSAIVKTLINAQVAAIGDLRNLYGDGHGDPRLRKARPVEARQAIAAAGSVCAAMLDLWHRDELSRRGHVECGQCSRRLDDVPRMVGDRAGSCPECGSMTRNHFRSVVENL